MPWRSDGRDVKHTETASWRPSYRPAAAFAAQTLILPSFAEPQDDNKYPLKVRNRRSRHGSGRAPREHESFVATVRWRARLSVSHAHSEQIPGVERGFAELFASEGCTFKD